MKNMPAKQLYLLSIIVIGLITISACSTYALFSFESSTKDVVTINTPNSLNLATSVSEYKQIEVSKNSYITTDIDVYNNFDYDICYSIWYRVVAQDGIDPDKVKVYEKTTEQLATSGILKTIESKRINVVITNDNDEDVKVNIGIANDKKSDTCNLYIQSINNDITEKISNYNELSSLTIDMEITEKTEGYLTYKEDKIIDLDSTKKLYVAEEFTYHNELFTLKNPIEIESKDISKYISTNDKKYYTCLYDNKCNNLIKIDKTSKTTEDEEEVTNYHITNYDLLVGYLAGANGLKNIGNDYYYYGDNPDNFIYYNCSNLKDSKTCELWRILGYIYDEKTKGYITKIIRNEEIDKIAFDDEVNIWNESDLNEYLNSKYKLYNTYYLKNIEVKQENVLDLTNELTKVTYIDKEDKKEKEEEDKTDDKLVKPTVAIINLTDYVYTSICNHTKFSEYNELCLKNNWLNNGITKWTMTAKYEKEYIDPETEEPVIPANDMLYTVGNEIELAKSDTKLAVHPVVYLTERTLIISGDGSLDNPYIVR